MATPGEGDKDSDVVKRIAALVMQGAVMLPETCPLCGSPLLRLKSGDIVCPIHGKVIVVKSEEEAREVEIEATVSEVEHYAARKIKELMEEGEPREILLWLQVIEVGERIREVRGRRLQQGAVRGEEARGREGEVKSSR